MSEKKDKKTTKAAAAEKAAPKKKAAGKKKSNAEQFEYQAELQQLLHLIVHSLYTHPEIFLRELISNASDALNKIRFRLLTDKNVQDPEAEMSIKISIDSEKKFLTIEDSGIGMTRDDLINRIGTVASSGTLEFVKQLKKNKNNVDGNLIGQFGVGFYSVFMVTDLVTIETRHAEKDGKGYRWQSDGRGTYTIEEIDKATRGTKISFRLNDASQEFTEPHRIRHVINKYSNFVDFPIFLNDEEVNKVSALWHRQKSDITDEERSEFYKFISNDYADPLAHLHLSIEGVVNFKSIVFIPNTPPSPFFRPDEEKSLQLYSNKIFIQDDCKELLPDYLRFLKGVVDTEDLPLNVSREVTQNSPTMIKIKNTLVSKVFSFLEDLSRKEPEKFRTFYKNFGNIFKMGINSDFSNRERLINLLHFSTTRTEGEEMVSLKEYCERMAEGQNEIYYLSGEQKERLLNNPNLEYFRKKEIEVLLLTEPADIFIVPSIGEYEKKPLKSIDKADIDLKKDGDDDSALKENLASALIEVFKEALGDKVEDVIESKRLVDSPATLVIGKEGMDTQMEKMMRMMQQDFAGGKRILEINTSHPLIKNLSRLNMGSSTDPLLRKSILQIYEGALLMEGSLNSPGDFIKRMTEIMTEATK